MKQKEFEYPNLTSNEAQAELTEVWRVAQKSKEIVKFVKRCRPTGDSSNSNSNSRSRGSGNASGNRSRSIDNSGKIYSDKDAAWGGHYSLFIGKAKLNGRIKPIIFMVEPKVMVEPKKHDAILDSLSLDEDDSFRHYPVTEPSKPLGKGGIGVVKLCWPVIYDECLKKWVVLEQPVVIKSVTEKNNSPSIEDKYIQLEEKLSIKLNADCFPKELREIDRFSHKLTREIKKDNQKKAKKYLIQPYVEGTLLEDVLRQNKINNQTRLRIIDQLIIAVEQLHALDWGHCDLKPKNILYNKNCEVIRLIDLGSAIEILDKEEPRLTISLPYSPYEIVSNFFKSKVSHVVQKNNVVEEDRGHCEDYPIMPTKIDAYSVNVIILTLLLGIESESEGRLSKAYQETKGGKLDNFLTRMKQNEFYMKHGKESKQFYCNSNNDLFNKIKIKLLHHDPYLRGGLDFARFVMDEFFSQFLAQKNKLEKACGLFKKTGQIFGLVEKDAGENLEDSFNKKLSYWEAGQALIKAENELKSRIKRKRQVEYGRQVDLEGQLINKIREMKSKRDKEYIPYLIRGFFENHDALYPKNNVFNLESLLKQHCPNDIRKNSPTHSLPRLVSNGTGNSNVTRSSNITGNSDLLSEANQMGYTARPRITSPILYSWVGKRSKKNWFQRHKKELIFSGVVLAGSIVFSIFLGAAFASGGSLSPLVGFFVFLGLKKLALMSSVAAATTAASCYTGITTVGVGIFSGASYAGAKYGEKMGRDHLSAQSKGASHHRSDDLGEGGGAREQTGLSSSGSGSIPII